MPYNGFKLFKIFGITVYLHWLWILGAIYEYQVRKYVYHSPVWNILEYISLFVIVLMHEFGHALACKSVGGQADRIILWPLGGVAYVKPPLRPGPMLWSIVAGPLVNVLLIPFTTALPLLARSLGGPSVSPDVLTYCQNIAWINIVLLVFNILPIYPLDGGKILWSLLWFILGMGRSLQIVSVIGIIGAVGLGLLAVYSGSGLLGFIAFFAAFQAWTGFKSAGELRRRETVQRRPGVACPNCGAAPPLGPYWNCSTCGARFDAFDHQDHCPGCGKPHAWNTCLSCGARAPFAAWSPHPPIITPPPIPQNPA